MLRRVAGLAAIERHKERIDGLNILVMFVFVSAMMENVALGFTASQRNAGLMLAATAGALPDLSWLYLAFTYFPLYLLPLMLRPLARRVIARAQPPATRP